MSEPSRPTADERDALPDTPRNPHASAATEPSRTEDYAHLDAALKAFADTGRAGGFTAADPARTRLREHLVLGFRPVVVHIARRYRHRGEPLDDLEQAGMVGLLNALDRYDPDQVFNTGRATVGGFLGFAVPTVTGEIRRHFRDRTWALRVPRAAKDLQPRLLRAQDELAARHHRAPRISELADHLGVDRDSVITAQQAREVYTVASLDAPLRGHDGDPLGDIGLGGFVGRLDPALTAAEAREALRPALRELPDRERTILTLRFVDSQSQTQIAALLGVSQMHVSRVLAATIARLHRQMTTSEPVRRPPASTAIRAPSPTGNAATVALTTTAAHAASTRPSHRRT